MDTDRPDSPKPTAKVVPIRRTRLVNMGRLDAEAVPPPRGFRVATLEVCSPTGEVLERVQFGPGGRALRE